MRLILTLYLLTSAAAFSQTFGSSNSQFSGTDNEITVTVNGVRRTFSLSSTLDLSGKTSVKPFKVGTSLPATCGVGAAFFKSDATAGQNIYMCTSTNTWTQIVGAGGGTGSVTSVDFSAPAIFSVSGNPVTTSGTISLSLAAQTANYVFAGPTSGGNATPTFRALVAGDIPTLAQSKITSLTTDLAAKVAGASNLSTSDALTYVTSAGTVTESAVKRFASGLLLPASNYLSFGSTSGSSGYGLRDNSGTMEYKNSGGAWTSIGTGGGGTPGGSSGQIQYNNSGSFGGYTLSTGLEVSSTNLRVNTSTVAPMPLVGQAVIDFTSIAAQTCTTSTVTVTGANAGDPAYLQLPSGFSGDLNANVRISASDTATIKVCNPTSGSIDPASGTFGVIVQKLTWTVGTVYHVGPGQSYTTIASVPWDSLVPGDEVRIYYNGTTGYREKWHIGRSGTYSAPIRVVGIRGPLNERPIINGQGAVAKTVQNYWNEDRGVIKIGGPAIGTSSVRHVIIEGLEIRNARFGNTFTGVNGVAGNPYAENAAAVYVEGPAAFITIRDNYITNNGDGIFAAGGLHATTIEGNYLYLNGYSGSSQQHNSYVQGYGTVYQFNRYELSENHEGNNLKDRGVATVVRYNQLIDGNRALDLVNGIEQITYNFPTDYIYGNFIRKRRGYNNNQIIHYGWDTDSTQSRRNLYFYNNTIVATRESPGEGTFVVLKVDHASTTAYAYNNAFWHYSLTGAVNAYYGGDLVQGPGLMTWANNWIYQGNCTNPALYCTRGGSGFVDGGSNIWSSGNPYISESTGQITSGSSPLINAASSLSSSLPKVRAQYPFATLRTETNDIGALEY